MRKPELRFALPWLIGLSLGASLACVVLAIGYGVTARTDAKQSAVRELASQADTLARAIEADVAVFDLALREAAVQARAPAVGDAGPATRRAPLLEHPLTSQYVGFINILNEVGDVVANSRPNVSRPVNFAGRDYFQGHLKNPADAVMIGRPFAIAPNQHPSIPISRRLSKLDGGFDGVVVAGVRLDWLSDLLSRPKPGEPGSVTVRRDDGLVLMRHPFDADAIGRGGEADPAWREYLRTGLTTTSDDAGGLRLFRRIGTPVLILEIAAEPAAAAVRNGSWPVWLPWQALIPALCVGGLSIAAWRLRRGVDRIEAAARAANEDRMRLLATMSHELRTPLTGILGQAELMSDEGGLNDHQAGRLSRLREAGTLMRNIVNRVINLARPDDHRVALVIEPCDLERLVRTCGWMVEGEARRKGLRLASSIDPTTPGVVMLARDVMQQVLVNLLNNAVKFTAQGTIALRVMGDAAHLRFEVADTGPGIPAGKRRRLFRAYDRLDTLASDTDGTGLGLSITEGFVLRMGGRIGHVENPGGGSVFWVELPTEEPDPGVRALTEDAPAASSRDPRRLRVLLADDLDVTRDVTADYLRSAGHAVTVVSDGEAAVDAAQQQNFDVILTDMRMPIVDGLEATRQIRALPGHRGQVPVVLLTADLAARDRSVSGQAGVDLCVMKPFSRAELLAAVATAARLTPVADEDDPVKRVLDEAVLADLRQTLGDDAFPRQIREAARRIDDLLALLSTPDGARGPAAREAAHDLVGVAGMLGLTALCSRLMRFDIAEDRVTRAAELREAATEAAWALRRPYGPLVVRPEMDR